MRYREIIIISALIILALVIRIYAFSITDNAWGADPDERIRVAVKWLNVERTRPLFPGDLWLPLHYYMIALIAKLFNNIPFTPRLMHLILAVLTILPFYKLIRMVFNEKTAIISTIFLIFYPIHILCSVVTLSEGPFLFFLVSFLYLFFKYNEQRDLKLLFLSFLFFLCLTMTRYEGWLFIIVVPFLLFMEKRFKESFVFLYAALLFPVLWMSPDLDAYSRIMIMLNRSSVAGLPMVKYKARDLLYWTMSMVEYLSLPFLILLILGSLKSIREKKKLYLFIFPLAILIFFSYGTFTRKILNNTEFNLSFAVLFMPFAAYGLLGFFNQKRFGRTLAAILFCFILLHMTDKSLNIMKGCKYDVHIKEIAEYLKGHIDKNTKVLLHNHDFQMNHIPVYIGKGIENFAISGGGGDKELLFKDKIAEYVMKEKPDYLVYSDQTDFSVLPFERGYFLDPSLSVSASVAFESGPYKIYSLRY